MAAELPFQIVGRATGQSIVTFIASAKGVEITSERYPIGSGKRRREVAELWAGDERLRDGTDVTASDVEHVLESRELETKRALDERDAELEALADDENGHGNEGLKPRGPSQATMLVNLVNAVAGVELWHDPDGNGYATVPVGGHNENWPIRSRRFRQWISGLFYDANERVPGGQALQDAVTTIEGQAVHRGREYTVHVRLAEYEGNIYLDLADADWRVVRITSQGWETTSDPPVKFRRARGMLPLPVPTAGGDINDLRRFVNVRDDGVFTLIVAWLIGTFHPRGPYAILEVDGEQGSAKTSLCRMLRRLVDPNVADLRTQPRDERDLVIAARNGHVVGFDNLSGVPAWLSDALSRIATGTGFGTRELYSNDEEVIFSGARPIVCNGIGGVATRSDLLDRTIRVDLPAIPENRRKPEADLWRDFDAARPALLGAILDAVATALRRVSAVRLDRLPRMADFARWVTAAEPSLPWQPGEFLAAYAGNREAANELALEASPVAGVLSKWFERRNRVEWIGTATELLGELERFAFPNADGKEPDGWPKRGNGLSSALKRLAPNLRAVGIDVGFVREGRGNKKRRAVVVRPFGDYIDPIGPTDPDPPDDPGDADLRGRSGADGDATANAQPSPQTGRFDPAIAGGDDGNDGDGRLHDCSNPDDDDSDRREREAIMAVEGGAAEFPDGFQAHEAGI